MSTKVVYFTKSGNTKKIAEAISAEVGCVATSVETPITEYIDTLFLGASVYKMGVDKAVVNFIEQLDPKMIGQVALFSTSAISDSGYSKLVKCLEKKQIKVANEHFHCKGSFMFMNKNRPNQADEENARHFARTVK